MSERISFDDITVFVISNDVWEPSRTEPIPGWEFIRDPAEPIAVIPSGVRDIPDTRYYKGYFTDGHRKLTAYQKIFWHGGPNSGDYFVSYQSDLPKNIDGM